MRSYEKVIDGAVPVREGQAAPNALWGRKDSEMIERLSRVLAVFALLGGTAWAGSMNGVAGSMPAYYDGTLFTINFMELASGGEAANLAHNGSINTIYMCDTCEGQLPGGGSFVSVIDAIQGDGFNPLWQEVQISFNAGVTPQQFTSDNAASRRRVVLPWTKVGAVLPMIAVWQSHSAPSCSHVLHPLRLVASHRHEVAFSLVLHPGDEKRAERARTTTLHL